MHATLLSVSPAERHEVRKVLRQRPTRKRIREQLHAVALKTIQPLFTVTPALA